MIRPWLEMIPKGKHKRIVTTVTVMHDSNKLIKEVTMNYN